MSLYRNNKPYRLARTKAATKGHSFYLLAERAKQRNAALAALQAPLQAAASTKERI